MVRYESNIADPNRAYGSRYLDQSGWRLQSFVTGSVAVTMLNQRRDNNTSRLVVATIGLIFKIVYII
jgi:hypothetical protein